MLETIHSCASSTVLMREIMRTNPIDCSAGGSTAAIVTPAMSAVRIVRGMSKRRSKLTPDRQPAAASTQMNGSSGNR